MAEVTTAFVKALAAANGLDIPDERLDVVRRQYESYLRTLDEIGTLDLPREAEPSILFTLGVPGVRGAGFGPERAGR